MENSDGIDGGFRAAHYKIVRCLSKLLLALVIASGLLGQMAVQAFPVSAAPMPMSSSECAKMMELSQQSHHKTPCDLECLAKMASGVAPVLEARNVQTPAIVRYLDVVFYTVSHHLAGLQVEPEIFPPIALI